MNWGTIGQKAIEYALMWLIPIILILVFHNQISSVLQRLSKLKYKEFEAEFAQSASEAKRIEADLSHIQKNEADFHLVGKSESSQHKE